MEISCDLWETESKKKKEEEEENKDERKEERREMQREVGIKECKQVRAAAMQAAFLGEEEDGPPLCLN